MNHPDLPEGGMMRAIERWIDAEAGDMTPEVLAFAEHLDRLLPSLESVVVEWHGDVPCMTFRRDVGDPPGHEGHAVHARGSGSGSGVWVYVGDHRVWFSADLVEAAAGLACTMLQGNMERR